MQQINNNHYAAVFPFSALGDYFRRVLKKKSVLGIVVGRPNSGKSETMASLAAEVDKRFCRADLVSSKEEFYTRLEQKVITDKPDYGTLIPDDFGSEADAYEFLSEHSRAINHLFQKARTYHILTLMTVPDPSYITKNLRDRLPEYRIEVEGHNTQEGYAVVKILKLVANLRTGFKSYNHLFGNPYTGEIHSKYREGDGKIINHVIPAPGKEFTDWYRPFRENLGKEQLITSKNRVCKAKRTKAEDLEPHIQKIIADPKTYQRTFRGAQLWDINAISVRCNVSERDSKAIRNLLGKDLLSAADQRSNSQDGQES